MASFVEPWEWDPAMLAWTRMGVEANGRVYMEVAQDDQVDQDIMYEAAHEERNRGSEMNMACTMIVPTAVMSQLEQDGVPVYDPDEGNEALQWAIRRDYPNLRTEADKGKGRSGTVSHI